MKHRIKHKNKACIKIKTVNTMGLKVFIIKNLIKEENNTISFIVYSAIADIWITRPLFSLN